MANTAPRLDPDVLRREVEDELLLYSPRSGETLLLNATAAAIAELCTGNNSESDIVSIVLDCIPGAPRDAVTHDVSSTLTSLRDKGMLA